MCKYMTNVQSNEEILYVEQRKKSWTLFATCIYRHCPIDIQFEEFIERKEKILALELASYSGCIIVSNDNYEQLKFISKDV